MIRAHSELQNNDQNILHLTCNQTDVSFFMERIYKTTSLVRNMTLSPDIAGILMGGRVTLDGIATRPLILFEVNDLTLAAVLCQ